MVHRDAFSCVIMSIIQPIQDNRTPEFLAIGHVTRDVHLDGSYSLGGTVTFAAVQARSSRPRPRVGCATGMPLDVSGQHPGLPRKRYCPNSMSSSSAMTISCPLLTVTVTRLTLSSLAGAYKSPCLLPPMGDMVQPYSNTVRLSTSKLIQCTRWTRPAPEMSSPPRFSATYTDMVITARR